MGFILTLLPLLTACCASCIVVCFITQATLDIIFCTHSVGLSKSHAYCPIPSLNKVSIYDQFILFISNFVHSITQWVKRCQHGSSHERATRTVQNKTCLEDKHDRLSSVSIPCVFHFNQVYFE